MAGNDALSILQEYEDRLPTLSAFTDKIQDLVAELLQGYGIKVHSINSRSKEKLSLENKLNRPDAHYTKLEDVKDLCGVRIITYFSDEVDEVAKIIESEFSIDEDNSVDKRAQLDPDRFGYISLHYVCSLTDSRLQFTEYRRYEGCEFEVQIRSILQHTWAEIEHDLGYKSEQAVPRAIIRRFSQLAGLLELADDQFALIRDQLKDYSQKVPRLITETPATVSIDRESLSAYLANSPKIAELDKFVVEVEGGSYTESADFYGYYATRLIAAGFKSIADVDTAFDRFSSLIRKYIAIYWGMLPEGQRSQYRRPHGISLIYLGNLLLAEKGNLADIVDFLKDYHPAGVSDEAQRLESAERRLLAYRQAVESES